MTKKRMDINVTQEAIERNFKLLNVVMDGYDKKINALQGSTSEIDYSDEIKKLVAAKMVELKKYIDKMLDEEPSFNLNEYFTDFVDITVQDFMDIGVVNEERKSAYTLKCSNDGIVLLAYDGTEIENVVGKIEFSKDKFNLNFISGTPTDSADDMPDSTSCLCMTPAGKMGINVIDPKATLHSSGSTVLGCALGPTWSDIGNNQMIQSANETALYFNWKDGSGNQRTVLIPAPTSGSNVTITSNNLWISSEFTPVVGTVTSINHGITIDPIRCKFDVLLKCVVADNGYAVGEFAMNPCTVQTTNNETPLVPTLNATTIQVATGSAGIMSTPKAGGNLADLTLSNWRYVFRIWY